jgi:hypothetical protein
MMEADNMAKLLGTVFQRDGAHWVMVSMPSGETPNLEHPSTFGYTEDVGPFATPEEAQEFLETGVFKKPQATGALKRQIVLNGDTFIVESNGRQFIISKKGGTPGTEEAILVMQAYRDGKGNVCP